MNKLLFDVNNQVDIPTLILETKAGTIYGSIDGATELKYTRNLTSANKISFTVAKYINGKINPLWNSISDLKTIYIPEYAEKFQIKVTYNDEEIETKSVEGTALAEAELGQTLLRNFECNTDTDLEIHNYNVTVFYSPDDTDHSLLHRVLHDKCSHYTIGYVEDTLKDLAFEYTANEKSIYDFLVGDVAEQMQCLFSFDSMTRTVNVYDLCSTCNECYEEEIGKDVSQWKHYRDDFHDKCPNCGSTNIFPGYGKDTTILIDRENLANSIVTETDVDSLKNCIYVEGGDDDINATFIMMNPSGGQYIYYYSPEMLAEMPSEFQIAYNDYTEKYNYYYKENVIDSTKTTHKYDTEKDKMIEQNFNASSPDSYYVSKFNNVVNNISGLSTDDTYAAYKKYKSETSFTGQPSLVVAYYNAIDIKNFIQASMMPTPTMEVYDKYHALSLLTQANIGTVAVSGFAEGTVQTVVENAILQSAKTIINTSLFSVDIITKSYDSKNGTWNGIFSITDLQETDDKLSTIRNDNYLSIAQDEGYTVTDTIPSSISLTINGDMETYCKNRINYIISKSDLPTAKGLYELDETILSASEFEGEIKLYSIDYLNIVKNVMQSAMDVLQDKELNSTKDETVKNKLQQYYNIYYDRQVKINNRISVLSGYISDVKMYSLLMLAYINDVQSALNFQKFLENYPSTTNLLDIFNYYRREGTYKNDNIISDSLETNADVVKYAGYLMGFAKKEAIKVGTPQITVTNSLNNLLAIPEFAPIVDDFEVGNWIKIRTNIDDNSDEDTIYNLRLLSYTISFDGIQNIDVEFSTVTNTWSGIRDISDVVKTTQSMATSFGYVEKQVEKAYATTAIVDAWVNDSLDLTNQKIASQANDQSITIDEHGILARRHDEFSDTYDPCQSKFFSNGLYFTTNNWQTIKTGLGKFKYLDPRDDFKEKEGYGVIADTIVSNIVLTKELGIYNMKGSMCFNDDGLVITNNKTGDAKNKFVVNPNDNNQLLKITRGDNDTPVLYTDNAGNLNMVGTIDTTGGYIRGNLICEGTISGGTISGAGIIGGTLNIGDGNLIITEDGSININDKFIVTSEGEMICQDGIIVNSLYGTYTSSSGTVTPVKFINTNSLTNIPAYKEISYDSSLGVSGIGHNQIFDLTTPSPTFVPIVKFANNVIFDETAIFEKSIDVKNGINTPAISSSHILCSDINGCCSQLANSGNTSSPMTFNYSGQSGTPAWVWGSDTADGSNNYIYSPSNFSVNYATGAHKGLSQDRYIYTAVGIENKIYTFSPWYNADGTRADHSMSLGRTNCRWTDIYCDNTTISTSDRNQKDNIQQLTDKHLEFFLLLQPVSFTFKDGSSGRTHIGFISQDVEEAMKQVGLTDLDFAGFCKNVKTKVHLDENGEKIEEPDLDEDGNIQYVYSLRYGEFIALNTYILQNTRNELLELKETVGKLMDFVHYEEVVG